MRGRLHSKLMMGAIGASLALSPILMPTTEAAASSTGGTFVKETVSWNSLKQSITGFGGSDQFMASVLQYMPNSVRSRVLTLLFSPTKGIGLTMIRSLVNDGTDGQTIEPAPGQWNWNILPDGQIWMMKVAKKFGATTLMASPASPPAWMKKNNSVGGDGDASENQGNTTNALKPSDYHAYAVYLANYVNGYWKHFHVRINYLSLQNEPNWNATYTSCIWTPAELHTFLKNDLLPVFKQDHVNVKLVMPESYDWSEDMALPTLKDPTTAKAVSVVAAHGYSGIIAPFPVAEAQHKQVWETEVSSFGKNNASITDGLKWATTINQYLTVANVNAWFYFWLFNNGSDNEGLINLTANYQYILNKRLFTLGNYSRFVRPGYTRMSAPNQPSPGVYVSAFKDVKTGHFAVVVVNNNSESTPLQLSFKGMKNEPNSVTPYVTSAKENLKAGKPIPMSNDAFETTLEGQSVTTYVG